MDFARNIFMFSFYTHGMSFIDMAYLKKKDPQNGILSYRRQKTGQQLFVKREKPMQEIVDKYRYKRHPLSVDDNSGHECRRSPTVQECGHLVNDKLKKLGEKLELSIPLTSYVAHHGWASIARSRKHPACDYQRSNGARFGEDHADLSRLFGHLLRRQGE